MKNNPETQLPLFGACPDRSGQDNLTIAEYPIALLSEKPQGGEQIRRQEWPGKDDDGRGVVCSWTLSSADSVLPVAGDEPVYMVLMQLTREQGNADPVVTFTRNEICDRLGLDHSGKSYGRIRDSIRRLHAVNIRARYLIRDAAGQLVEEAGFHVLSDYALYDERRTKGGARSYVRWSDTMWESIAAGFLKLADVSFYLTLTTPTARRLWRYLDKKRHGNRRLFSIGLKVLCQNHLFMTAEKPSDMRRQIEPAHAELIERGFLQAVTYGRRKDGQDLITYQFTPATILEARGQAVALPPVSVSDPEPDPAEEAAQARQAAQELTDSLITPEIRERAAAIVESNPGPPRPPRRGTRLFEARVLEVARAIVKGGAG